MNSRTTHFPSSFTSARNSRTREVSLLRFGALLALGAFGSLVLSGCGRTHANATAPRVVRVVQIGATPSKANGSAQYTGVVRARTESNLGFRVAGKVSERLVDAGEKVKKGQPLLKLDPVDYQLGLQSARAAVDAARAVNTQTTLEQERVRTLVEKRAESRDALERATAVADSSAAQLRAAEAQANQIANQAGYTTLFADADGIVMSTLAEPGQVVSAGQPVIVLAKDGPREAAVDIPEGALAQIRNQPATARLYLNQSASIPASLREVSGVADPVARTYQARYVLEGDSAQFPLGSTVTIQVSAAEDASSAMVAVPLGSLIDRGEGASVWVVDAHTSAIQKRPVSIAKLGAEHALIGQGLRAGDLIVALGAQLLNSGEVVRYTKPDAKELQ